MQDLVGPDIRNSVFAHILHLLLIGGVVVYGWQAVTALVRRPTSVGKALRKGVYAAWLAVLFLLLTQPNPVPYLPAAGVIAAVLIAFALWDRFSAPAKREDMQRS
jgi:TRAP-type C4-dicarboxylate transport system permease small subunit